MTRRTFFLGAMSAPLVISACRQQPRAVAASRTAGAQSFTVRYEEHDVRCLFHDQLVAGDSPGCLLIVLLHGSGADASQWIDIGLVDVVDHLDIGTSETVDRVVAVAPDIADTTRAHDFVVNRLLPYVDRRFGPGMVAISGISSGAASALQIARDHTSRMGSVGLHSPAIHLGAPVERASWSCFLDVGDDDPLADAATRTAEVLRRSGIAVQEHHWSGGHDRRYWRSHLRDYMRFHVDAARRRPA